MSLFAGFAPVAQTIDAAVVDERPSPGHWFGRHSQRWHPPIPGYSEHAPRPDGPVHFTPRVVVYVDDPPPAVRHVEQPAE